MYKPSDKKRFRRSDFKYETVSTLIERNEDESKKNASVGAVSLQSQLKRNNILKSTNKRGLSQDSI